MNKQFTFVFKSVATKDGITPILIIGVNKQKFILPLDVMVFLLIAIIAVNSRWAIGSTLTRSDLCMFTATGGCVAVVVSFLYPRIISLKLSSVGLLIPIMLAFELVLFWAHRTFLPVNYDALPQLVRSTLSASIIMLVLLPSFYRWSSRRGSKHPGAKQRK